MRMHIFGVIAPALLVFLVSTPAVSLAEVSGSQYELNGEINFSGSHHTLTGSSYSVEGDIGPFGGALAGSSYSIESGGGGSWYCGDGFVDPDEDCDTGNYGTMMNGGTCTTEGFTGGTLSCSSACAYVTSSCTSSSGGGGGGGGGAAVVNTSPSASSTGGVASGIAISGGQASLSADFSGYRTQSSVKDTGYDYFTFNPFLFLYGLRGGSSIDVKINDVAAAETGDSTWADYVSLAYGINTFSLQASSGSTEYTPGVFAVQYRPQGDANGDLLIDDYDMSLVIRRFGVSPAAREADFNEDSEIDEFDVSLVLANWDSAVASN